MPTTLAAVIGWMLRTAFALLLRVRRPRPIHPRGTVLTGEVLWNGQQERSGIAWVDQPPGTRSTVVARVSRSVGLPAWLPDVVGLALRVQAEGGPADVELASTGIGVPGRYALMPVRSPGRARLTSILPYRGGRGPVLVAALPRERRDLPADPAALADAFRRRAWRLRLCFATPAGRWYPFAELSLHTADDQDDASLRFDAVRRPLPGAGTYPWAAALRQPSYRLAQD